MQAREAGDSLGNQALPPASRAQLFLDDHDPGACVQALCCHLLRRFFMRNLLCRSLCVTLRSLSGLVNLAHHFDNLR